MTNPAELNIEDYQEFIPLPEDENVGEMTPHK
jgi:hypothetical protein